MLARSGSSAIAASSCSARIWCAFLAAHGQVRVAEAGLQQCELLGQPVRPAAVGAIGIKVLETFGRAVTECDVAVVAHGL